MRHAIVVFVAFTETKSIVLSDKPESHMHLPLLATFMHADRLLLRRNDVFTVIATHPFRETAISGLRGDMHREERQSGPLTGRTADTMDLC